MVNARIRKTVRETHAKVGYIGPPTDFNYDYQHLGTCPQTLSEIAEGRHPFYSALSNAKNPVIIVGAGIFERNDKDAIFSVVETIAKKKKKREYYQTRLERSQCIASKCCPNCFARPWTRA
ncbi:hypothetical protein LOK49_LG02G02569 [Camellia lanceoleosa]|uniref:Uncharacterized protein n=1 Tax=Camellia lanceoleosa TaxID=1840588 RepID=A0ACC0IM64_9ERIC|nr:hypothetical protein LOK49_LG02G02569 [Camellia lanceoleosa]